MSELFIEVLSEEIPYWLQKNIVEQFKTKLHDVIIENQFNKTDHKHLGQQLVYAAKYNAKIVIWISDEFDEQHIEALRWLNQISGNNVYFFGIKFELFKIGSSPVAMELIPAVRPLSYSPDEISGKKFVCGFPKKQFVVKT